MREKMFKKGTAFTAVRCGFLLMIVGVLLAVLVYFGNEIFIGKNITKVESYDDYVYLDAVYMSSAFGVDDKGNNYLFVSMKDGERYSDYILSLQDDDYAREDIQQLIKNSYGQGDGVERTLRLHGYVSRAHEDLSALAQEHYGAYVGREVEDASLYLGNIVLVHSNNLRIFERLGWSGSIMTIVMVVFVVSGIVEIVQLLRMQQKKNKKIALARELFEHDADYRKASEELDSPMTVFYKSCKCYLTPHYVVSFQHGPEVFAIAKIKELYGYDQTKFDLITATIFNVFVGSRVMHSLVAVTEDNEAHLFAELGAIQKVHNEIVTKLVKANHDILLGRNSIPYAEVQHYIPEIPTPTIAGFYGSTKVWEGRTKNTFLS